ncbi:hypothetical protein B9Z55_023878 [Caenorhabditis nigoni]|uniref:poly(ADP-ribose) glycohydrolase n=1 Tax=Caenorhabditis nigoni TaxID=1611254 RepID=A0A2G5SRM0_9PELO|nr:hypothetical protein B9Z55_023878 [Caenorhabditis nigoni]
MPLIIPAAEDNEFKAAKCQKSIFFGTTCHHEEQRQSPSAPTTSHQARQQSPLVFDEDEHDLERGFEESSTSSRRAETSQSYDPHQDHREDTVQAEEYEFDEDEYGFGTGLREPSNGSGIRRLVVDDIIDNDQDTLAPSTTTTSNPQPELPNHSQQLSIPQHQQPSQYQQPSCPVQDPSHRSLSPDVFSPAIQSPQKSKIPEESVNVEVEEDLKMEVDEDEDPEDGPPSNLAEYTQLGSSEGSLKIDEDDPPVTEKRVKGAPASRDEKMELEEEPIGVITDEQCTTDFRYLLEEQFHERKLEFLPDFEAKNFNTSKDYRYCEIPGLPPADSQRPYRDNHHLLNQIQWRPFHPYMSNLDRNPDSYRPKPEEIPNRMYRTDKNTLEQWLKEHRYSAEGHSGGFQMFSHVLHELGRICNGYNSFAGLLKYFNTVSREKNSEKYVLDQFANVVRIALKAEEALPKRIYRLTGSVESATFSHVQCAALLARMFFKPIRSSLSFHYLLEHDDDLSIEKLRFLFAYFDRIATNPPDGCVSFRLKTLRKDEFKEEWIKNKYNPMPDVRIYDEMVIEETALCTQVDFANEYLGGGVLASGAVQEEIRFLMCPEMIVGMLLTDKMNDDQAISIVGAYVYSGYTGYARDLKWHPLTPRYARQNDTRLRDKYGRLRVETTAIDATYFKTKGLADQVAGGCMSREMKKAFTGFSAQSEQFDQIPIVSGFWGCGAFNGHKPLKFLQQVIIAGMVKRPLVFCTFQEAQTKKYFEAVMERLRSENISIGVLNLILREIAASQPRLPYNPTETFVFDFVFQFLADPQNRELLHSLKPLKSTS